MNWPPTDHSDVQAAIAALRAGTVIPAAGQAFGDSITYGYGVSAGQEYPALVASGRPLSSYVNSGVSGDQAWDQATPVFAKNVAAGDLSTLLIGTNDQRTYSASATKRASWQGAHLALLTWLAIPDARKIKGQSAAAVKTGTWSNSGAYAGVGVSSQTVGDAVTVTTYGRTAYVCGIMQDGNTATYSVTIDGRDFGTYAVGSTGMTTYNGRAYGPYLLRFAGLSDGAHTVVLKVASASAGNPAYFLWAAGSAGVPAVSGPFVYVGTIPRFTAAGYAASGGSDAAVRAYNDVVVSNTRQLQSDGLNVALADTGSVVDPATMLQADGVHPLASGHVQVAAAFLEAMTQYLHPRDQYVPGGRQAEFVGVKVLRSAAYNAPAGSLTPIPWDAEEFDTHGFHDSTTWPSHLTVPPGQAGFYFAQGSWGGIVAADQTRVVCRIRKNNADIPGANAEAASSGAGNYVFPNAQAVVYLDEGDYLECATFQSGVSAMTMDVVIAGFTMYKVGPPRSSL